MRFSRFFVTLSLLSVFLLSSCGYKGPEEQQTVLRVACFGDSITSGFKLANPARQSYPAHLSRQSHGLWQVLNLGINGATVINKGDIPATAQKAYQHLMRFEPDVVVIMLGTNDTKDNNWTHIGDFVSDYNGMIEKIRGLPSRPHIIVCSIPPIFNDYPNGITASREKEINVLVRKVVDVAGVDFFDINTLLSEKPSLFVDGIHPNANGSREIAALIYEKISSLKN